MAKKPAKKGKASRKTDTKKSDTRKKKKETEKYVITGLVIALILVIAYAIVNIEKFMPDSPAGEARVAAATVNGDVIYEDEVDKYFRYLSAQFGPTITREFVLNHTINQRLLLQEAQKQGISVDMQKIVDGVDEWLVQVREQVGDEELMRILSAQNITLDEFRNDTISMYHADLTIVSLLNQTVFAGLEQDTNFTVTDDEVRQYYEDNRDQMHQINASHILVCFQGAQRCTQNRTKTGAEQLINSIYEELKETGDFEGLSAEFSDDPNGQKGGNLGYFSRGMMVPEFEEAAFSLKHPGQLSEPVLTDFGYHIIKLNSVRDDFKDFVTQISMQLQLQKQQEKQMELRAKQEELMNLYIKGLREQADIRVITANRAPGQGIEPNAQIQTFNVREGEVCREGGRPIIRLFSTTSCPHCTWVRKDFEKVAKEYGDRIVAYHWELDTGDDTLTDIVETGVPAAEEAIFREFNPRGSIPTFVFGCRYYRIGTGHEQENDHIAEQLEFRAVIEELLK